MIDLSRWWLGATVLGGLGLAACGAGEPADGGAEPAADTAVAPAVGDTAGLVRGTPAGGLEDWVRDIVEGTADLPAAARAEPGVAQARALDLYVSRQEYIELYYGPGGRLGTGAALGAAVDTAEARFHALMRLLGGDPPPDSAGVAAAVEALRAQLQRVVSEAQAEGAPMDPRAAAGRSAGGGAGEP